MSEEIFTIGCEDERYPPLLRHIPDRPRRLYIRGSVAALNHAFPVAVVGTRSMSRYGETAIAKLIGPLAGAGFAIISGLALGVDAAAHEAALSVGGVTVAVLAAGVDRRSLGPKTNAGLAERIVARGGALISEHPPGTQALKHYFPLRNRIIAGMSKATIVIEAPIKSGALLTSKAALEYDRDVFAVPGPITYPSCEGTNRLLFQGATPICNAGDLLDHYGVAPQPRAEGAGGGAQGAGLLAELETPRGIDELMSRTGMAPQDILAQLSLLELDGLVMRSEDGWLAAGGAPAALMRGQ